MGNIGKEGGIKMADKDFSVMGIIIRIITTAIVLAIAAFITPWFSISGIGTLIIASIVIGILVYFVGKLLGLGASPFGRGITGFAVTVIVLYLTKLLVSGFEMNLLGAILGALVIGIVDAIIPGETSL